MGDWGVGFVAWELGGLRCLVGEWGVGFVAWELGGLNAGKNERIFVWFGTVPCRGC